MRQKSPLFLKRERSYVKIPNLNSAPFTSRSSHFQDFLRRALQKNPESRWGAPQLQSHPFPCAGREGRALKDLIAEAKAEVTEEIEAEVRFLLPHLGEPLTVHNITFSVALVWVHPSAKTNYSMKTEYVFTLQDPEGLLLKYVSVIFGVYVYDYDF